MIYLHTARARPHVGAVQTARTERLFQPAGEPGDGGAECRDRGGPLYDIDTRLRPEGGKGMLVVSLDTFERYQRKEAWTWEHMALCRARPVFGSPRSAGAGGRDDRRDPEDAAGSSTGRCATPPRMRDEIDRHKPPHSELDVKLGAGGLVDLEFAVHVLQLTRCGLEPRLEAALEDLADNGLCPSKYC